MATAGPRKRKSPAEAGQVSNQRLGCVRHPESAAPYPDATLRASRMQGKQPGSGLASCRMCTELRAGPAK